MSDDFPAGARPSPRRTQAGAAEPDAAMVARAASGDRDALGVLWEAWNPMLVRFLGSLRVAEPDDVAADVWVDLARRMPSMEPEPEAFRRLLFTIGRRRAIDARRYRGRRPQASLSDALAARLAALDDASTAVIDAQHAQQLLAELPPTQAEVVALRVLGGLSAAEVAEITGRSEGAVRIMAMRGLRRLRELVTRHGVALDDSSESCDSPNLTVS